MSAMNGWRWFVGVLNGLAMLAAMMAACAQEAIMTTSTANLFSIPTNQHRPFIADISPPHSGLLNTLCNTTSVAGFAPKPIAVTR